MRFDNMYILPVDLSMFAGDLNPNTTASEGLSDELKTYYSDYLIDLAEPELVHDQFGLKQSIPQNGGKTIEWRQFASLPEMTTPLEEGITPDGQSLSMDVITATIEQYGGYATLTDMLNLTAIDPMVVQATKAISSQAGRSLDTVSREALNAGTFVMYAGGKVDDRSELYYTSAEDNCNLTAADIKRVVREMETANVPKINGYYMAIIHPYCKFDLTNDPAWKAPHEYNDTANIYNGEIGELYGVRFVQASRAKVWEKAGAANANVYSTLIMGEDAYGVVDVQGGGLQHFVKQLGSGGTADPLTLAA